MASKQQEQDHADPTPELEKEGEVVTPDAAVAFMENRGAVVKSKSPSNAALLKAGLKTNLSSSEAAAQLRVLCRKFAALTEKVKEETKVREAAEREVRRLKALLDKGASPVVASCRAETQAFVRELKETQEKLKRELKSEKEKNERVVAKALELEREKSALLATQSHQQTQPTTRTTVSLSQPRTSATNSPPPDSREKHQSAWDKEQLFKIQSTLKLTIAELEEELSRKEEEARAHRERSQRDRARIKALEDEIRAKDEAQCAAKEARRQLEADLQQAQTDITNELENMQRIHDQAQEDRAMRDTLEQQLVTLGEVNAALEQRSRALVRRLEISSAVTQECQDLKLQVRDAEVDNETLVQTIRNLKEEQFNREKDWKVQLEWAKNEKVKLEQQILELREDIASLQAQNSLFSEWMLVRNENAIAAQRDAPEPHEYSQQETKPTTNHKNTWHLEQEEYDADNSDNVYRNDGRDISPRVRSTSSSRRGRRPCSPSKSVCSEHNNESRYMSPRTNLRPSSPQSSRRHRNVEKVNPLPRSPRNIMRRKMSTTSLSSQCSSATSAAASSSSSSVRDDHERLRKLMTRNRELQQRLQQETLATQHLEQEITDMTA